MRTEIPQMGKYRRSPRPGESNLKRMITERPPTTEKCSMPTGVTHPDPGEGPSPPSPSPLPPKDNRETHTSTHNDRSRIINYSLLQHALNY